MKKSEKYIIAILVYVFLFFIFCLFFMSIIKGRLDSQLPSFEQLMDQGINQNFELKLLGVTLQRVIFTISSGGEISVKTFNERALYLFPVIFSLISTSIIGIIINKAKKYVEKWKV